MTSQILLHFFGFLKKYGLEKEVKVNIESGHAFLAGHSFEHEIALANALDIFGSNKCLTM